MNTPQTKVLICDDSATIGTTIASALSEKGFFAYTRNNTENAIISSIISERPDVVISCLTLRDSDIVTLMKKTKEAMIETPAFVVISELYNSFIEKQVMNNGASYFITAPINTDELAEAVEAVSKNSPAIDCHTPELLVTDMIKKICIPAHLKGYRYVRSCILECLADRSLLDSITKRLYPVIAIKYSTTPARVERAIRTAIESAWERADNASIRRVLGYEYTYFSERPTNSEFIAMLTDKVRLQFNFVPITPSQSAGNDRISFFSSSHNDTRAVL